MVQHDLAKIVGKNIAEQRRTIGISQKDLAQTSDKPSFFRDGILSEV